MDKFRLIAEMRKRPVLWNFKYTAYYTMDEIAKKWKELAKSLGDDVTVEDCKITWQRLRNNYRKCKYRTRQRIERDKRDGKYHPKKNYGCKWIYMKPIEFFYTNLSTVEHLDREIENRRKVEDRMILNSSRNDNNISSHSSLEDITYYEISLLDDNSDEEEFLNCQEFFERYTKNNQSRLNKNSTPQQKPSYATNEDIPKHNYFLNEMPSNSSEPQSSYYQIHFIEDTDETKPIMSSNNLNSQKSEQLDQVIDIKGEPVLDIEEDSYPFLEGKSQEDEFLSMEPQSQTSTLQQNEVKSLEPESLDKNSTPKQKDENLLIKVNKNVRQHSRSTIHENIADSDYNFLISFLSHMKTLNTLQNLQFRAKMSDLILNFLTIVKEFKTPECKRKVLEMDISDPDCNFLISFWPFMKSLTQLQNLQYRAKVTHLIIDILSKDKMLN
ncbi:uncharacterized protein LOC119615678 [Lucilia sericata]|uniref:uncharacterized protein LOC119615678 n=1 Tax=Lucilia sericata TaxID=13632 RepID=UPI0018A842CB|nr:uncharacterized protein LOC119615678 [Lucilia sericata]